MNPSAYNLIVHAPLYWMALQGSMALMGVFVWQWMEVGFGETTLDRYENTSVNAE